MTKRSLSKGFALVFRKIVLVASVLFIFWFFSAPSIATSPEHWIHMAENSCIYEKNYTVDRKTNVYKQAQDSRAAVAGTLKVYKKAQDNRAAMAGTLVEKGSGRLSYTKQRGLRIKRESLNTKSSQENTYKTISSPKPSPYILDVGHMLLKMKGKVQWVLEDENASIDNQDCAVLSSSGDKWLVRLWIRKKGGVVLRYNQYINNQFISTSQIEYYPTRDGKYLPKKTTSRFHLTGHTFVQEYDNYSFSEAE